MTGLLREEPMKKWTVLPRTLLLPSPPARRAALEFFLMTREAISTTADDEVVAWCWFVSVSDVQLDEATVVVDDSCRLRALSSSA
jgi:hypothetical protein